MTKEYYVYGAYGLHGELLYIGKGSGNRYQHCNSGISSNKALNRYYFANGEEGSITVKILHHFDDDKSALQCEKDLIIKHEPLYNTDFCKKTTGKVKNRQNREDVIGCLERGYKVDYRRVMKIYLEAIHNNDTSVIELIDEKSPEHKYHYDTVGEATIKSLSYNKTKIKHAVSVAENFNENYLNVISNLGLRLNTKYTCHELKSKIQQVYSELGITKTAKATDVKLYYSVRQCYKDRRDAFEILGHKTEVLVNED